jgi:hypothetical protein
MVEAQVVGLMKMPVGFVNMCNIDQLTQGQLGGSWSRNPERKGVP